jgi:phosphoribosylanthranilate isomerase
LPVETKICGVNAPDALAAALAGGARYVGFNFYPPSPRHVALEEAAALAANTPPDVARTGVFVDPDDDTLAAALAVVPLDILQLHGAETPARAADIRRRFALPVMKAIKVAHAADVDAASAYVGTVDRLLFDAPPPKTLDDALPGGNAVAFDWRLLAGRSWPVPWMLSGGLEAGNVAEAIAVSGARAVDVSSGVEDRRGHKSPAMIKAFLAAVAAP